MTTISIDFDGKGFSQTSPKNPNYVSPKGDIDISSLDEDDVKISWTLTDGKKFRTSGKAKPVTLSGNGNGQVFTVSGAGLGLSNEDRTYTIQDANRKGSSYQSFQYTLHEEKVNVDPSIKNRR